MPIIKSIRGWVKKATEFGPSSVSGPPPVEVEKTRQQIPDTGGIAGVGLESFGEKPSESSLKTYRRMRKNPTVALARRIATAPIKNATWSYHADEDAPDEWLEFIRTEIESHREQFMRSALLSLDYGYQAFELIWSMVDGNIVTRKVKPLIPDITEALIKETTGQYVGLQQGDIKVPADKTLWITNEREGDNYYGESRHDNIKEAWASWSTIIQRELGFVAKVGGAIPVVEYPPGQEYNAQGQKTSNFELAKSLIAKLGSTQGVAMPNTLVRYAEQLLNKGFKPSDLVAWNIKFLEAKGQHGAELVTQAGHKEALMLRGWLVPERAAIEGKYGTKAEAAVHADVAVSIAEETLVDITTQVNWHWINRLLAWNFGPEAENTVWVRPRPLIDEQREKLEDILSHVMKTKAGTLQKWLDVDASFDQLGWPKAQEIIGGDEDTEDDDEEDQSDLASALKGLIKPGGKNKDE